MGLLVSDIMERAVPDRMPEDVLIVEDDPIIALDFEDTILGFGVKTDPVEHGVRNVRLRL